MSIENDNANGITLMDVFTLFFFPDKNQEQQSVIVIFLVVGIIAFLFITMLIVLYKCLKRQITTDGTEDIEIPNVRKLEAFHAEEQCENNAVSGVYDDISDCFTEETDKEATYIILQAENIEIISSQLEKYGFM